MSALVCDGASCDLALLKQLCGVKGMYRTPANEDGGVGQVPSSFTNPYSSGKVYVIVCPSHQVHTCTHIHVAVHTLLQHCDKPTKDIFTINMYMHVHTY